MKLPFTKKKKQEPPAPAPEPPKHVPTIKVGSLSIEVQSSEQKQEYFSYAFRPFTITPTATIELCGGGIRLRWPTEAFPVSDIPRLIEALQLAQTKADELWPKYKVT